MNHLLRTTLALAVSTALAPCQAKPAAADRLARLCVIEEQEGDLRAAEAGYRELLAATDAAPLHAEAAYRLGAMLWRLGRRDDGKPFLDRATAAGGAPGEAATKILQGQGDADRLQAERLVRARAVTARLTELLQKQNQVGSDEALAKSLQAAQQELAFLGDAAATALVETLRSWRQATPAENGGAVEQNPVVLGLAEQLWSVGTEPAAKYLAEVCTDPMLEWRRAIASRCGGAAPDLTPVAIRFLRDGDPAGDVQRSVTGLARRFPGDTLAQLVTDPSADCRAAGWIGLSHQWSQLGPSEQDAMLAQVGGHFVQAMTGGERRIAAAAERFRDQLVRCGPRAGHRLVLGLLAKAPLAGPKFGEHQARGFTLDDDDLALLVATGRSLGTCAQIFPGADAEKPQFCVALILALHQPAWSKAGVDGILELVELGYAQTPTEPRWVSRALSLATESQLQRLVRTLPRVSVPRPVLDVLIARESMAGAFGAIRDAVEAALAGPTAGWMLHYAPPQTPQAGRTTAEGTLLLSLAAKAGDPDAGPWLAGLVERAPALADAVASSLVQLSLGTDHEQVRAAMRKMLVWPGAADATLAPRLRGLLFAELARLGDEGAIPLFAQAIRLGVEESSHPRLADSGQPVRQAGGALRVLGKMNGTTFHRYDDAQSTRLWKTLLTEVPDEVLTFLTTYPSELPTDCLAMLVRQLPRAMRGAEPAKRQSHVFQLCRQLRRATPTDVEATSDLRRALVETIVDPDELMVFAIADGLADEVLGQLATEVRARARTIDDPGHLALRLLRAGVTLSAEEWRIGLRGEHWGRLLAAMPAGVDANVQAEVRAMLHSADANRRAAACSALARWLSTDAVAPLLEALRDPAEAVRTAATDALQRIRFHREQGAFWADVKNGIDASPAGTAAKLLAQAQPSATKDQRLLAIRSLGALGAPEALPHLIEWTKDHDTEIAAGARAAIDAIHQHAAARK